MLFGFHFHRFPILLSIVIATHIHTYTHTQSSHECWVCKSYYTFVELFVYFCLMFDVRQFVVDSRNVCLMSASFFFFVSLTFSHSFCFFSSVYFISTLICISSNTYHPSRLSLKWLTSDKMIEWWNKWMHICINKVKHGANVYQYNVCIYWSITWIYTTIPMNMSISVLNRNQSVKIHTKVDAHVKWSTECNKSTW